MATIIDKDGINHGVMTPREANALAQAQNAKLVQVNGKVTPPIYRIMSTINSQRLKQKKPKVMTQKKIGFSCKIAEHDQVTKVCM